MRRRRAVRRTATWVAWAWASLVPGIGLAMPQSGAGSAEVEGESAPGRASSRIEQRSETLSVEEAYKRFSERPSGYFRSVFTLAFGRGLRFNNPYRLQTQLGAEPESLSLTATYIDLGAAVAFGEPNGIQHGGALHLSAALSGVSQQVLIPSYFAAYRGPHRVLGYARFGPAFILSPDPGAGFELSGAGGLFITAKVAVYAELVGNVFYGAGTTEVRYGVYPVLSGQIGLLIDHEVLP
ncbi:MAG TPA: hypothetical protein VE093_44020 [Polyangiaceae bacterium]|nr:hypothetical protein [Polyangiaceae bacterium]